MRLLGIIRGIGEARQWMTQTGPVTIYPVTFEAEGNTFIGDLFASANYITSRGICPGAVGYFDITFKVRDVTTRTGEVYKRQDVRLSDFRLANQNLTGQQTPATEAAPQAPAQPTPTPEEVVMKAAEAAEQARVNGDGLPF